MMRHSTCPLTRPDRGVMQEHRLMTAIIQIGGVNAFVLFDSGCTIEALNPLFVRVANIKVHQLAKQHSLQLGTVGSRAKFNFGAISKTTYSSITDKVCYDIINIDRYDRIE